MKAHHFPLIKITIWLILGILFSYFVNPAIEILFLALIAVFLFFVGAYWFSKKSVVANFAFGLSLYTLVFTIGSTTYSFNLYQNQPSNYIHLIKSSDVEHQLTLVLLEKLNTTKKYQRYIAEVTTIDNRVSSGKIIVNFYHKSIDSTLIIGNIISLKSGLILPESPKNPNQFDYGKYLAHKSIGAQLFIYNKEYVVDDKIDKNVWFYTNQLRNRIIENLKQNGFQHQELNTVAALLLGQRQDLSSDIIQDYQLSGAIHILSVSGLHVGYLFLTLTFLLGGLPKSKWFNTIKLIVILFVLWGFALLAGFSPSVIRSVTMFSAIAIGQFLKRQTNVYNTLCVALFLILLIEPNFIFDIGFQLSFVAVFFIVWLYPHIKKMWKPKYKIINYLWEIFAVSLAAQIGTLPISLFYFHQFPGLFFITNIVVLPFLGFIMILGVLVLFLAAFNGVPIYLSKLLEWGISLLNAFIHWIASYDNFVIREIPFNGLLVVTTYILIIAIGFWIEKTTALRFKRVLIAIVIFQVTYFSILIFQQQNKMEILVFNMKNQTIIAKQNTNEIDFYCSDSIKNNQIIQSYLIANLNPEVKWNRLQNVLYFNGKRIEIIDSSGVYSPFMKPDIVMLTHSPKFNFERMVKQIKPKLVIADASNYKSLVEKWSASCYKQKIPFYDTRKKGFYRMN